VHCLTGQGGAGKTRLAIELCEWAEAAGWSAGFVLQDELAQHHRAFEWRWSRKSLIVVDYGATAVGPIACRGGTAGAAGPSDAACGAIPRQVCSAAAAAGCGPDVRPKACQRRHRNRAAVPGDGGDRRGGK
jgi:hypothetical protein